MPALVPTASQGHSSPDPMEIKVEARNPQPGNLGIIEIRSPPPDTFSEIRTVESLISLRQGNGEPPTRLPSIVLPSPHPENLEAPCLGGNNSFRSENSLTASVVRKRKDKEPPPAIQITENNYLSVLHLRSFHFYYWRIFCSENYLWTMLRLFKNTEGSHFNVHVLQGTSDPPKTTCVPNGDTEIYENVLFHNLISFAVGVSHPENKTAYILGPYLLRAHTPESRGKQLLERHGHNRETLSTFVYQMYLDTFERLYGFLPTVLYAYSEEALCLNDCYGSVCERQKKREQKCQELEEQKKFAQKLQKLNKQLTRDIETSNKVIAKLSGNASIKESDFALFKELRLTHLRLLNRCRENVLAHLPLDLRLLKYDARLISKMNADKRESTPEMGFLERLVLDTFLLHSIQPKAYSPKDLPIVPIPFADVRSVHPIDYIPQELGRIFHIENNTLVCNLDRLLLLNERWLASGRNKSEDFPYFILEKAPESLVDVLASILGEYQQSTQLSLIDFLKTRKDVRIAPNL